MTTINMESFKDQYRLALVFSMIEGLGEGKSLCIDSKDDPQELAELISKSDLPSIQLSKKQNGPDTWTLKIEKPYAINTSEVGCCGMCGGESPHKKA